MKETRFTVPVITQRWPAANAGSVRPVRTKMNTLKLVTYRIAFIIIMIYLDLHFFQPQKFSFDILVFHLVISYGILGVVFEKILLTKEFDGDGESKEKKDV